MTSSFTEPRPDPPLDAVFHRETPVRGRWAVGWPGDQPPLSDVLPHFESLGFRVDACTLQPPTPQSLTTVHYEVRLPDNLRTPADVLQEAFAASWTGLVEVDSFSRLVGLIGLTWHEVLLVRALARYLSLAGLPHSPATISRTLIDHAAFTHALVRWFTLQHEAGEASTKDQSAISDAALVVNSLLEDAVTLDADRIMRALHDTAQAVTRTNYAQRDRGQPKPRLSLKISSSQLSFLPRPRPVTETFVYSATMEGLHLRGGRIARGGLRWSDRTDDFRTEVLALMKAQQVKNAVIVPVGAKGAFICKGTGGDRPALGRAAYRDFVNGLLDITDNIEAGTLVPPPDTVILDDADPYLVVAADKGTATFSDLANSIALERSFWLGDAFASGGSRGYDHKAMGITARGAWVSVREHLRRTGINPDTDSFTVVGIGDMSGDVFGNGIQLSPQLRLIAAFDHRHIFVDPDPNPEVAHRERARLAAIPGSSWADYSTDALSPGGGVWPRSAKRITLSTDAVRALGLPDDRSVLSAHELIKVVLNAPVDLLYNGGVGTYVKSASETNTAVGDPANDAVRVDASDMRARAVVEGGNLGLTQQARVELALSGTSVNTDFIDNSAGVDTSDLEVNLKILLDPLVRAGRMSEDTRNSVLRSAEEDVAAAVLAHNARSVQAITAAAEDATLLLDQHAQLMLDLEAAAGMERDLEQLPDAEELETRRSLGAGLTRPEIAVLLAWSKNLLREELLVSDLPDDTRYSFILTDYFPAAIRAAVDADDLPRHRLAREIISTGVANALIDEVGPGFLFRMQERTGVTTDQAARAYVAARDIFDLDAIQADIDNARLPHPLRLALQRNVRTLLEQQATRLVRRRRPLTTAEIGRHREAVTHICGELPTILSGNRHDQYQSRLSELTDRGAAADASARLAALPELGVTLDTVMVAQNAELSIQTAARLIINLEEHLAIGTLRGHLADLPGDDHWTIETKAVLRDQIDTYLRRLAKAAATDGQTSDVEETEQFHRYRNLLDRLDSEASARLTQLTVTIDALGQLT